MSLADICFESSDGPALKMFSFSVVSCSNFAPFDLSVAYFFALVSPSNVLAVAMNVRFNFNGVSLNM